MSEPQAHLLLVLGLGLVLAVASWKLGLLPDVLDGLGILG